MIESKNNASKNLEKALQALSQAKQRVANEKKKQNEKKRKAEVIYSPFGEASFTCNGQYQQAGICGRHCLSCDSQKGKRLASCPTQFPFASCACYP